MNKRALITGITGQDGSYLAEHLLEKGYDVFGLMRRTSLEPLLRLEELAISRKVTLLYGNVRDCASLERALKESRPAEVYNLAAQSDVGISFKLPEETMETNYYGLGRLVNEAVKVDPAIRIYQASTSEMFGKAKPPQNEQSPFEPVSPYSEAKLKAHEDFVRGYREKYGLYICSGILFNHESPRRGEHFVTRKITLSLAKVKLGIQDGFSLGNLDAKRDWGFAGDYVKAMHLMLQKDKPDDYVIGTGEAHSVRDFVEAAALALDMRVTWEGEGLEEVGKDENGKTIVTVRAEFYRPTDVDYLMADSSKARRELGWSPSVDFNGLVSMMAQADLAHIARKYGRPIP